MYKKHTKFLTIQRKIVAETTTKSWREIPHVAFDYEPDITELFALYEGKIKPLGLSFNVMIIKLIVEGLKEAKKMNAEIVYNRKTAKGKIITKEEISVSMPMIFPTTGEMMTVNLHSINDMTMFQLREYILNLRDRSKTTDTNEVMYDIAKSELIERIKHGQVFSSAMKILINQFGSNVPEHFRGLEKKLYEAIPASKRLIKEDLRPGTVTISNIGSLYPGLRGSVSLLEILPGQVAAMGLGSAQDKAKVVVNEAGEKEIGIRKILPICIAFDHRALDFNDIIPFVKKIDEICVSPQTVLNWVGSPSEEE